MSQFDVHHNTGRNAAQIPYVVIVQSASFDGSRRRVVVPLWATECVREGADLPHSRINPVFVIKDTEVILHPLQMASVPLDALGQKVDSLPDQGDLIIAALDEVFSRAWG